MKEVISDSCHNCPLIRQFDQTTDVFGLLDRIFPIPDVLEHLHEIPPTNLKCICCIYGNSLWRLPAPCSPKSIGSRFAFLLWMTTRIPFIGKYIDKIFYKKG